LAFTDAGARAPHLVFEDIDRSTDHKALLKLAEWLVRFSPRISLDGDDALVMDVTGIAHLFGGEAALAEQVRTRLKENGYTAQIALANTIGSACAFARFRANITCAYVANSMDFKADLGALSVQSLRLSDKTLQLLRRFGLTRVGQLYGMDRKALTRRFSSSEAAEAVVLRLDQALDVRHEPLKPLIATPEWAERLSCPEPIASQDGVEAALDQILPKLCDKLNTYGLGARDFQFLAFCVDGSVSDIEVSSAQATRDDAHIRTLLKEHIARINPSFGIDLFMLLASRTDQLDYGVRPLSSEMAGGFDADSFIRLADRLSVRLGKRAVYLAEHNDSHIPERAECFVGFDTQVMTEELGPYKTGPRPLRMFENPERVDVIADVPDGPPARFVWRRKVRKVVRAEGPERIAPEWWKLSEKGARARDYYRIEDEEGRRYWIYRHGLYDDNRGGPPQWYVQGMFA
jgi:protein ImuB